MSRITTIEHNLIHGPDCIKIIVGANGNKTHLPFCTHLARKGTHVTKRPITALGSCLRCPYYTQAHWLAFWRKIECPD